MSAQPYFFFILELILSERSESKDLRLPRRYAPRKVGGMEQSL